MRLIFLCDVRFPLQRRFEKHISPRDLFIELLPNKNPTAENRFLNRNLRTLYILRYSRTDSIIDIEDAVRPFKRC